MRHIYYLTALVSFAFACFQPAMAQGYDPNQAQYAQGGYQQPPVYQQYGGLPQTTPNYGYADPSQYGQQQQYAQQPAQGQYQQQQQPVLQQQYAQYGQMQQTPTYYGQAQQTTQGSWPAANTAQSQPNNSPQMPAGSFLNNDTPDNSPPPDKSVTETPSGGGHGGAMIKGAAGLLGKFAGGVGKVAAPAASMYLMNKAVGGNMRVYMPAPMMPMPGMGGGYNPYMGSGMRSMMGGGW